MLDTGKVIGMNIKLDEKDIKSVEDLSDGYIGSTYEIFYKSELHNCIKCIHIQSRLMYDDYTNDAIYCGDVSVETCPDLDITPALLAEKEIKVKVNMDLALDVIEKITSDSDLITVGRIGDTDRMKVEVNRHQLKELGDNTETKRLKLL